MEFIAGFAVWLLFGLAGGFLAQRLYRAENVTALLTFVFGVFGAFIGGMLGTAAYIFHDPLPLRAGGLIGAALGGAFFAWLYHFIGRHAT